MKKVFFFIILSALSILASCKLTGNFAIVKRQHAGGYYLQIPSFVKNSNSSATQLKKHVRSFEKIKPVIISGNDNLIASVSTPPIIGPATHEVVNFDKQSVVKAIARDTIKKEKVSGSSHHISKDGKKMDSDSLIAFILICVDYLLALMLFINSIAPIGIISGIFSAIFVSNYAVIVALLSPILGIILGFVGKHHINKDPVHLKGIKFARKAIIMGFLIYPLTIIIGLIVLLIIALG